ncbi:hypothetical protein CD32_18675 [Lysinibacillus odysseyi 34hs-1 = NBRC 100172]|uniref:Uncharacterized protein n=1 Tax=Lysinibacillus odysseyi 34hs-1 = NBRC 100172 TaxID=1220589 RepID=A0A0A3J733_9BACI|nr:hypothetical protein CD32_18675 [Lysinibacillus odysseyi 34hs-1 = NBRC 100172]
MKSKQQTKIMRKNRPHQCPNKESGIQKEKWREQGEHVSPFRDRILQTHMQYRHVGKLDFNPVRK